MSFLFGALGGAGAGAAGAGAAGAGAAGAGAAGAGAAGGGAAAAGAAGSTVSVSAGAAGAGAAGAGSTGAAGAKAATAAAPAKGLLPSGGPITQALGIGMGLMQIVSGGVQRTAYQRQANLKRQIAQIESDDAQRDTRRLVARQTVGYAASGVEAGAGSPLDVLGDTVAEAELARLRGRFLREVEATALEHQGKQAQAAGIFSGVGTILGSVKA